MSPISADRPARLDFRFSSPGLALIGDIRTLSDESIHRENPIRELAAKLYRYGAVLSAEGIRGGFDFRVNGVPAAPYGLAAKQAETAPAFAAPRRCGGSGLGNLQISLMRSTSRAKLKAKAW